MNEFKEVQSQPFVRLELFRQLTGSFITVDLPYEMDLAEVICFVWKNYRQSSENFWSIYKVFTA